jgi:hypothetical protein
MSNTLLKIIGLTTILSLTACGGNDSSSNQTPPKVDPIDPYVTIKGTAVTRDFLSDAIVTARCKDDSGFKDIVKTNINGEWEGQVKASQLPCRLKVTKDNDINITHYSVIFNENDHVNITPFTDLAIAIRKGFSYLPSDLYGLAGKDINYITLKKNLYDNNTFLVSKLLKGAYNIDSSMNSFNDVIEPRDTMINNIKAFRIAADIVEDGGYSVYINKVYSKNHDVVRKFPILINSSIASPNLKACRLGETNDIYTNCTNRVFNEFYSHDLVSRDKKQICLIHIIGGELHYLVINNSNYTDFEDYTISLESGYYDSALKVVDKGYKYTTYVRSQYLSPASPKEQLYKLDLSITDKKRVNGISFTPIDGPLDQIDHSTIKFADEYMCTVI